MNMKNLNLNLFKHTGRCSYHMLTVLNKCLQKKKKNLNNALRCLTRQPQPTLLILALTQPSPLNVFSPKKRSGD